MALGTDDGAERRAYKPARRPAQISRRHPRHLRIPGGAPTLKLYFSTMTDQDDIMEFAAIAGDAVVVPGLFFVSGAVFAKTSRRQISRKMEEQGHVTFC